MNLSDFPCEKLIRMRCGDERKRKKKNKSKTFKQDVKLYRTFQYHLLESSLNKFSDKKNFHHVHLQFENLT